MLHKVTCNHAEADVASHAAGSERRTLKVLLAIANGAHLLSPTWVEACLELGVMQPETGHAAATRFTATADAVRASRVAGVYTPPLSGMSVFVAGGEAPGAQGGEPHRTSLQRLIASLGGRVAAAPSSADVCVVCCGKCAGSVAVQVPPAVPRGMAPGAVAVAEEWLLQAAETYARPDMACFPLPA